MYQRAAVNENGSFVQAGYPSETAASSNGTDSNASVCPNPLQKTENRSADALPTERPAQNASRNGFPERGELLSRLRLSSLDAGDLLLAAILYFTLHDTGDDDLFWIAAILFLTGKGSDKK